MNDIGIPSRPWEVMHIDFATGFPAASLENRDAVMITADRKSRSAHFNSMHASDDAFDVAMLLYRHVFPHTGLPRIIISDRDPKFMSRFWSALCQILGVKRAPSVASHPQTDGLAERGFATLEDMLRRFVAYNTDFVDGNGFTHDWESLLKGLQFAYNSSKHATTGVEPYFAERGWIPRGPQDLFSHAPLEQGIDPTAARTGEMFKAVQASAEQAIRDAFAAQKKRWDAHHRPAHFEPGMHVGIESKLFDTKGAAKLKPPFVGPFLITEVPGPNNVKVELHPPWTRKHPVFSVASCIIWHKDNPASFPGRSAQNPPEPENIEGEEHFEVDRILDERTVKVGRGRQTQYRVSWVGYDSAHDQWKPASELTSCKDALREFRASRRATTS